MGRRTPAALFAILALAGCGSPPAQAQAWEVIVQPGGEKVARGALAGAGLVRGIGLTCERGVPMIALGLARAPGRMPAYLSLSDGRSTGKLGVVRTGTNNVWAGPVRDPRVLALLARAASVEVGVDGVRYGTVSLDGAGEAMRRALGGCWVGAEAMAGVAIVKTAPAVSPPRVTNGTRLAAGLYVPDDMKCSDVGWTQSFHNTAGEFNVEVIEEGATFSRKDYPARRITSTTTYVDGRTKFRLCPENMLAPDARLWPEKVQKSVDGLPIKPGLYRTFAYGKLIPSADRCGVAAEYLLFEPKRVAMVAEESIMDRNNYPTSKFTRVRKVQSLGRRWRQIGERVYENVYVEGEDSLFMGPWRVEAPDRFEVFNGECDVIQFRPVDPRTVPPALLPRW